LIRSLLREPETFFKQKHFHFIKVSLVHDVSWFEIFHKITENRIIGNKVPEKNEAVGSGRIKFPKKLIKVRRFEGLALFAKGGVLAHVRGSS